MGYVDLPFSDYTNISRFLNRILGIEVELQNRLFAYFTKTLSVVVQQAKRSGGWDEGILGKTRTLNAEAMIVFQIYARIWPQSNPKYKKTNLKFKA